MRRMHYLVTDFISHLPLLVSRTYTLYVTKIFTFLHILFNLLGIETKLYSFVLPLLSP